MGGERAATTRRREAGKICALCGAILDPPPWPGERICDRCGINKPRHRILMNFQCLKSGWHVAFLEADCKTPLRKKFTFASPEKIWEVARNGGAQPTRSTRFDFDSDVGRGRGGIWLFLTPDQYRKLK